MDGRAMHIRHSLHREDDGLVLLPPKTRRSRRTIPLPALVGEAWPRTASNKESERKALGSDWSETGDLFTTRIGTSIDPRNSRIFGDQCRAAGVLVVALQALRHTCVSLLRSMGAGPRVVMDIAGHRGARPEGFEPPTS
jgi:integrase